MKKPYPTLRCYVCHRPMKRAAALLDGYPVGPVCAGAAGLVPAPGTAAKPQGELPLAVPEPARDPHTIDMFELP